MKPRRRMSVTCSVSFRYSTCSAPRANTPKPSAANAATDVRMVATFFNRANAASIDGCVGVFVLDDLAEHVLLLVLAPGRLVQEEHRDREEPARYAEHEERPPPAFDAAGPGGDRADDDRAQVAEHLLADVHRGRHPGAHADGVVVGEQRLVHREVVRLGHAGQAEQPEQHERAAGEAGEEREHRGGQAWRSRRSGCACVRSASQPIGIAPSA